MKVYFTASLTGRDQYKEEYLGIVETLRKLGTEVLELVSSAPSQIDAGPDKEKICRKMESYLKAADLVVAEISYPSIDVGYEISSALKMDKRVLALRLKKTRSNILEGHPDEKFKMVEYDKATVEEILEQWLKSANEQLDVRFNFFIPPSIVNYLDWVARKKRLPRSVFLRNIIEKEMKADKEFKKG